MRRKQPTRPPETVALVDVARFASAVSLGIRVLRERADREASRFNPTDCATYDGAADQLAELADTLELARPDAEESEP